MTEQDGSFSRGPTSLARGDRVEIRLLRNAPSEQIGPQAQIVDSRPGWRRDGLK